MSEPNDPGQSDHGENNEREVTDPVTHLPLTIHDATAVELERIPPPDDQRMPHAHDDDSEESKAEESNRRHAALEGVMDSVVHEGWWRDPGGDQDRTRIQTSIVAGIAAGVGSLGAWVIWWVTGMIGSGGGRAGFRWLDLLVAPLGCCILALGVGTAALSLRFMQTSPKPKPNDQHHIIQDPPSSDKKKEGSSDAPESAAWLNSFLSSLWPIVNPSLFTSISDMIEDALQASLPKMVNGVRVADIGQGNLPVRIIGIRWLDKGSAGKDCNGLKAEEGDFVNLELALAYRAKSSSGKGLKGRYSNAHMLMEFYIAGGVVIPVWVELTGFLATARARIQLTPNPPFLSLLTLTLLGQPHVSLNCTPLAKNFLNVMDVPGLSGWIQSSINAAVAEYVAPRSLNLDLKTILMGTETMDTETVGVVVVCVRKAGGFMKGDKAKLFKDNEGKNGDTYVSVGWSKWGKPMWSTRIIKSQEEPIWEETTTLLVGPAELNSQERLMLQLWDSDRFTADDLCGNVDVELSEIMSSESTNKKMSPREDGFTSDKGKHLPGKLYWEVGYFPKTALHHHKNPDQAEEIKKKIEQEAEHKLREAKTPSGDDDRGEVELQKKNDFSEQTNEVIMKSPPAEDWPSGILKVQIEQIAGLEVQKIRESGVRDEGDDEESGDLPSAYCTIIINQQRVYKTRTKMKSGDPYYDAGTEKFIRDWRDTTVIISVRDSRVHEKNPLLGVIVLPLRDLFKHASMYNGSLPLVGGIGYGRMKLSLIFRSVQVRLPKRLIGWDVGTLEIQPEVKASSLPPEFSSCRIMMRTLHGKGKLVPADSGNGVWRQKQDRPLRLAVMKRYASCLVIQFRRHATVGSDFVTAFSTLWLKDIPDDEELTITLPVRRNTKNELERSRASATQDIGEKVGSLQVRLRLWTGLSGYHKRLASHDRNLADVIEVLDCAESSREISRDLLYDETDGEEMSDSSSSSSSNSSTDTEEDSGKTTLLKEVKDLNNRRSELHRKHRGLMQWSGMRKAAWVGRGVEEKAGKAAEKITGVFKHHDRDPGIEREV